MCTTFTRSSLPAALFVTLILLAACDSSVTEPDPPASSTTLTVDASSDTNWALVALGSPATLVGTGAPEAFTGWDLGFQLTNVIVNGGGGVEVYCVCQNAGASEEQIKTFSPESELADFEAVTAGQIPSSPSAWSTDAFERDKWYWYDIGSHVIYPTYQVYLVKRGSTVYKVQFVGYYGPTGASRQVTFRYAKLVD